MPIQFRCPHCRQLLSISSRKMGATVNCPACTEPIRVPDAATKQLDTQAARPAAASPPSPRRGAEARQSPADASPPVVPPRKPAATVPPKASPPAAAVPPTAPKTSSPAPQPPPVPAPVLPSSPAKPPEVKSPAVRAPVVTPPARPTVSPAVASIPKTSTTPRSTTENLWADEEPDEDAPRGVRESRLSSDGLDMTPMVDVTFQLLIFFMITASFVTQKSLQTSPPEPNDDTGSVQLQVEDLQDQSVVVNIDAEGGMQVDDVPVESASVLVETLMSKMATEQKTQLLIEADYNAKHGAIIQVIDAGLSAGMTNIRKTSRQDE